MKTDKNKPVEARTDKPEGRPGRSAGAVFFGLLGFTLLLVIMKDVFAMWFPAYVALGLAIYSTALLSYPFWQGLLRHGFSRWAATWLMYASVAGLVMYLASVIGRHIGFGFCCYVTG